MACAPPNAESSQPNVQGVHQPEGAHQAPGHQHPAATRGRAPVGQRGTARAIATVYGDLARGVDGVLGLTTATVDELERTVVPGFDEIFGLDSAFALGFMKPFPILSFGSTPSAYGHTGSGGSFGFADPATRTGYAYVMNRNGYGLPTDSREIALRMALQRIW